MISIRALRETITIFGVTEDFGSGSGDDTWHDVFGNPLTIVVNLGEYPATVHPTRTTVQLSEDLNSRDTRIERYTVTTTPDVPIDALSIIGWRGKEWEVVGEPRLWIAGNEPHSFEIDIRRIQG